jgi:putative membrane protein
MSYKNMKARKRFMAIALSGAMMLSVTGCGSTATGDVQTLENPEIMSKSDEELSDVLENSVGLSENTDSDKDETVYVIADAAGNKQDVIVSEWLKNTDGEATIKDSSNLTDIENVKGDETFTENNGELVWKADGNSIYYQGKSEEQVPVEVKATYYLDDQEITPDQLAGKSGKVKMRFEYVNNSKSGDVYTPFLMATGMILSNDKFSNIKVENGQVVNDGNNSIVVGMGMPGLQDSLDLQKLDVEIPDYFEVTADCTDFSLDMTMTVASTGFLSKDSDNKDLKDAESDINELIDTYSDGMNSLVEGITEYTDGVSSVSDGIGQVKDGADSLYQGSLTLAQGVDSATTGAGTLKAAFEGENGILSGSKQISDGLATLNKAVKGIELPTKTELSDKEKKAIKSTITENITNNLTANKDKIADGVDKDAVTAEAQKNGKAAAPSKESVVKEAQAAAPSSSTVASEASGQFATYFQEFVSAYAQMTGSQPDDATLAALQGAFATAYGDVYGAAYKSGYGTAYGSGYKSGYGTAYGTAYTSGYSTAYGTAYTNAFTAGYGSAYGTAYQSAYGTAYVEGYKSGYATAYQDGLSYGANLVLGKLSSFSGQITTLKKSVDALATGASALNTGLGKVYTGTSDLYNGMVKLNGGAGSLTKGANTLKEGAGTLKDGASKLTDASGDLKDGSKQLSDGTDKIVDAVNDAEKDLDSLSEKCDKVIKAGEAYESFGGISDDMKGSVKFIIKTDSISK